MTRLAHIIALVAALMVAFAASAQAVPIHHHVTVHKTVWVPRADRPGKQPATITVHRVEKYDVAPKPAPPQAVPTPSYTPTATTSTGSYGSIPGVPASFAACVAMRESGNGSASSNVYGILADPRGSGSLADQQAAFADLYAQYGTAPWAPYDGC